LNKKAANARKKNRSVGAGSKITTNALAKINQTNALRIFSATVCCAKLLRAKPELPNSKAWVKITKIPVQVIAKK
jgi:hypothetical protein